ncbi:hypothetical protein yinte0001_36490 [Yersinia intermedia ATCC 29909]|nr:hypothetical protein yinte0001_36490 [Yersinia intermedia ATCC 29909]
MRPCNEPDDGMSTGQRGAIEVEGQGEIVHRLFFLVSG